MTDKINYAEFVSMKEEEYTKLVAKYGTKLLQQMIERLDDYKGSKVKNRNKYACDYRVIRLWVKNEVLEENRLPRNYDLQNKSEQVRVIDELEKMKKPGAEELAKMKQITKLMFGGKDERS